MFFRTEIIFSPFFALVLGVCGMHIAIYRIFQQQKDRYFKKIGKKKEEERRRKKTPLFCQNSPCGDSRPGEVTHLRPPNAK